MKAIVAVDKKWGIGKNNGLLFSLPEDMKFFRSTTLGSTVVMGKNTLKSFPGGKPLADRTNIVIDPDGEEHPGCIVAGSLDGLAEILEKAQGDIFVIGGAMTYHTLLPYCEAALVTKVDADGDAEVFFDNLDRTDGWILADEGTEIMTNGYKIKFTTYKNKAVKPLYGEK